MKVLIADEDLLSLQFLRDVLHEWECDVVTADDGAEALELLQRSDGPVIAMLDSMMPGVDCLEVCRRIRDSVHDRFVYLIVLVQRDDMGSITSAIDAGADDCIGKPLLIEELRLRVRAGRRIAELERELRIRASHDPLTGLFNRGAIIEFLQKEVARHARQQQPVSIIFADIDHFKRINDEAGHAAGDAVLREVARRMSATLRPYDSCGRYSGEEMLAVLPSCDVVGALEVAERMRSAIGLTPVSTDCGDIAVTISAGVASLTLDRPASIADLLHRTESALYRAKGNGRNCIVVANDAID